MTARETAGNRVARGIRTVLTPAEHARRVAGMTGRYRAGASCAEIAAEYGVTRQSVHGLLRAHGVELRTVRPHDAVEFAGRRYAPQPNGYWRATTGDRELLHRRVWMHAHGPIPDGWDVHHLDRNPAHNDLANLQALPKGDHTRLHREEDRCSA